MILQTISRDGGAGCRPSPQRNVFVTRHGWILGSYTDLKLLAEKLREDAGLRNAFAGDGSVRIGLRSSDAFPGPQRGTRSFRPAIVGKTAKAITSQLAQEMAKRHDGNATQRLTEQFDEVEAFYRGKTLEAHHIVEKSILGRMSVNTQDLSDSNAPCILIAAELHQQLFTRELSGARKLFEGKPNRAAQVSSLRTLYLGSAPSTHTGLYATEILFSDLRRIAELIIDSVARRFGV